MLKKDMQKEIKKYIGKIFYFDVETKNIYPANWITSTSDYDHYSFELHHIVPFTDWEKNIKNVQNVVKENALILLPKMMHQHLENPIYKLDKIHFEKIYGINPDVLLFDINSRQERTCEILNFRQSNLADIHSLSNSANFLLTEDDLTCFDSIYDNSRKDVCYA